MSRKARTTRRSKIPMSIRNGEGGLVLLGPEGTERRSQPPPPSAEVARAEPSPPLSGPHPQAPAAVQLADDASADPLHPDDVSVPPIGLDSDFFGSDPAFAADSYLESDARDPRLLKLTPLMAQRRARFAKYVTVAVGSAAILCAAAMVKITIARGTEGSSHGAANRTATVAPPVAERTLVAPPVVNAPAEGTAAPQDPAAAPAPSDPPVAGQAAPPAAPPSAGDAPTLPADVAELDPKALAKEAGKAKAKARGALEWGKMGDAIEAGERSVAIDPSDGEAWLILGAAYQQKGDAKNAVRSFKACLDQGKRGPRNECAAMMR